MDTFREDSSVQKYIVIDSDSHVVETERTLQLWIPKMKNIVPFWRRIRAWGPLGSGMIFDSAEEPQFLYL